jgi:hypothetical protein
MYYDPNLGLNLPMCKIIPVGLCLTKYMKGLSNFILGFSDMGILPCLGRSGKGRLMTPLERQSYSSS